MAPAYKLTYFNLEALGESIRFLFAYGAIEYEDYRLKDEDWPKLKTSMPFGQVPILEHNGKVVHQSVAISRYIAKQVKLAGKDDWENLEIDSIVDTVNDLRQKMGRYYWESNKAIKESLKEPLFKETIPYYLERLNSVVKTNNGHLALGRLTWADLYFVSLLNYMNMMFGGDDIIAKYPYLTALKNKVLEIPAIKEWVEKRPKTHH